MVIGFLGKGGSGKSTLSSLLSLYLSQTKSATVLAIDADHNMDMTYNLLGAEPQRFLSQSLGDAKAHLGLSPDERYDEAFVGITSERSGRFRIQPKDSFTEKYSTKSAFCANDSLSIMAAGPHTDAVLHGQSCSHALFTALKLYLPFLDLGEDQYVIVDEKAGADGAGTGIVTGFDFAFIAVEPTVHSAKSARQIADILDFFEVPYEFIWNKAGESDDTSLAAALLSKQPAFRFSRKTDRIDFSVALNGDDGREFDRMIARARNAISSGQNRLERSRAKFERNCNFVAGDVR